MDATNGLLAAFSHLEQLRFGSEVSPAELETFFAAHDLRVKPDVITQYDPSIVAGRIVDAGINPAGYPDPASNSILRFKYLCDDNLLTHYALYDGRENSSEYIIDANGERKRTVDTPYGPPVAFYEYHKHPAAIEQPPKEPIPPPPVEPEAPKTYTEAVDVHGNKYKALPVPRRMYVKKDIAHRYDYYKTITHQDRYRNEIDNIPYGTQLYVVGEIDTPIPPNGQVYLAIGEDWGNFKENEHPARTYGYLLEDLEDGTAPPKPEKSTPPNLVTPVEAQSPAPAGEGTTSTIVTAKPMTDIRTSSMSFSKAHADSGFAGVYEVLRDVPVKELDGRKDPSTVPMTQPNGNPTRIRILSFFPINGKRYARIDHTKKYPDFDYWFYIPVTSGEHTNITRLRSDKSLAGLSQEAYDRGDDIEPVKPGDKIPYTFWERMERKIAVIIAEYDNRQHEKAIRKIKKYNKEGNSNGIPRQNH
jgi:hypothetical protein